MALSCCRTLSATSDLFSASCRTNCTSAVFTTSVAEGEVAGVKLV